LVCGPWVQTFQGQQDWRKWGKYPVIPAQPSLVQEASAATPRQPEIIE
jgi:hypothetical protein